jgi:DNA-binding response OmpR family regulator
MSGKDAARAFEVFFQGSNANNKGTGLGLPLSREFIQLHHGDIQVISDTNTGTTFVVQLPLGCAHFKEEEKYRDIISGGGDLHLQILEDTSPVWDTKVHTDKKSGRILIIEDHTDLRGFLQFTLQANYQIFAAADGQQGLQEALEHIPDLIICDLMLPDTDGLQLVNALKADLRTSHIPVIILTARSGQEQQLAGMQAGAELFLTKPFSPQILKESVRSLLANRQLAKEYFTSGEGSPLLPAPTGAISKLDKKFLDDFIKVINAKLGDSELSVDYLSREIGLSRVQLYRKIKALLGCNVNDYIQTARLRKSCTLLQNPGATIADVAYQVGFSSATYFSTAFKAKYNISPTDYKNQKGNLKPAG